MHSPPAPGPCCTVDIRIRPRTEYGPKTASKRKMYYKRYPHHASLKKNACKLTYMPTFKSTVQSSCSLLRIGLCLYSSLGCPGCSMAKTSEYVSWASFLLCKFSQNVAISGCIQLYRTGKTNIICKPVTTVFRAFPSVPSVSQSPRRLSITVHRTIRFVPLHFAILSRLPSSLLSCAIRIQ